MEQTFHDQVNEPMSQIKEEIFEVDKSALAKRISERICEHSGIINVTKISRPKIAAHSGADAWWLC